MARVIIEIQEKHVSQYGCLLIHGFLQDYDTGEISGISELSAPGFEQFGEPKDGSDVIFGYVEKKNKRNKRVKIGRRVKMCGSVEKINK
jgi:hypothetical protein